MLVKGYLANDVSKIGNEVEMVLDPKYILEIKQEYLRELLEATINHVVCPEYLELFEDVDEWADYKYQLMSDPEQLFQDFVNDNIHDMIEEKAEEVYQNNKPEYFPVDVRITCSATVYVKARTKSEVEDVMNGYELTADDILSDVGGGEYEIEDFWVGDPVDEDYIRYETVYDAKEYIY